MKKQLVSFVIPCYRSAETIGSVVDEIEAAMGELERYDHEIILVNEEINISFGLFSIKQSIQSLTRLPKLRNAL